MILLYLFFAIASKIPVNRTNFYIHDLPLDTKLDNRILYDNKSGVENNIFIVSTEDNCLLLIDENDKCDDIKKENRLFLSLLNRLLKNIEHLNIWIFFRSTNEKDNPHLYFSTANNNTMYLNSRDFYIPCHSNMVHTYSHNLLNDSKTLTLSVKDGYDVTRNLHKFGLNLSLEVLNVFQKEIKAILIANDYLMPDEIKKQNSCETNNNLIKRQYSNPLTEENDFFKLYSLEIKDILSNESMPNHLDLSVSKASFFNNLYCKMAKAYNLLCLLKNLYEDEKIKENAIETYWFICCSLDTLSKTPAIYFTADDRIISDIESNGIRTIDILLSKKKSAFDLLEKKDFEFFVINQKIIILFDVKYKDNLSKKKIYINYEKEHKKLILFKNKI